MGWDQSNTSNVLSAMSEMAAQTSIVIPAAGPTTRDGELVRFVGRHGAVAIEHVMAALGVGRTAACRRVAACVERGLLERLALLRDEPALLRATREGLRYTGLCLSVAVISPGSVTHWLICASVALGLEAQLGTGRVLSERELRAAERIEGGPIASARLGELPSGAPRLHRPDLALFTDAGTVAIEVELTPKAPRRLEELIRAWRRASRVAEVRYLCAPGPTRRAVERAVRSVRAESRVRVEELGAR